MGHVHNGILLGCKKEENFTLCNSMDGPGEHFASEISQSEKDKYHVESNEQTERTSEIETDP